MRLDKDVIRLKVTDNMVAILNIYPLYSLHISIVVSQSIAFERETVQPFKILGSQDSLQLNNFLKPMTEIETWPKNCSQRIKIWWHWDKEMYVQQRNIWNSGWYFLYQILNSFLKHTEYTLPYVTTISKITEQTCNKIWANILEKKHENYCLKNSSNHA